MGSNRQQLPVIREATGSHTITGMLNRAPAYVAFGKITEATEAYLAIRLEFININEINKLLGTQQAPFFPYVIMLDPKDPAAYDTEWENCRNWPRTTHGICVQSLL